MFRRRLPDVAPSQPPSAEYELPQMQSIDPHAFIIGYEQDLNASATAWGEIARGVHEKEPKYRDHIRAGLIEVWEANRSAPLPNEETIERETDKLTSELTTYCLLSARHLSAFGTEIPIRQIKDHFLQIPDHTVNYIIRKKEFPTRSFMMHQGWRVGRMRTVDGHTDKVLTALTRTYGAQPEEFAALAELYEEGAAEVDGRYRELQAMISTDWHHPDPEKSLLKKFLSDLADSADVFMPGFVREVAAAEKEHKLLTIKNMARFAIIARGGADPVTTEKVAALLASTYDRWNEFEDIDTVFRTYAQGKINDLTKQLTAIAGPRNFKSIRTYPTAEEVERLKEYFTAQHAPTRQARRRRARVEKRTKRTDRLPTSDDIARIAQEAEGPAPRKLIVAKKAVEGHIFADTTVDELVSQLKFKDPAIASDVKRMLSWLQSNPISGASQRLLGTPFKLRQDGKQLTLWRFAPNRAAELNIRNSESRRTRIVYALAEGAVIVVDIVDHDTFDQRYMSGSP